MMDDKKPRKKKETIENDEPEVDLPPDSPEVDLEDDDAEPDDRRRDPLRRP